MKNVKNDLSKRIISYHIISEDELRLSELKTCMDLINKSIEKYIKAEKIVINDSKEYSPVIKGVKNGSFIIDLICPIIESVGYGLLVEILIDIVKNYFSKSINFYEYREIDRLFKIEFKEKDDGIEIVFYINNKEFKW